MSELSARSRALCGHFEVQYLAQGYLGRTLKVFLPHLPLPEHLSMFCLGLQLLTLCFSATFQTELALPLKENSIYSFSSPKYELVFGV